MDFHGQLIRGAGRAPARAMIVIPEEWMTDLFRRCLGQKNRFSYFITRIHNMVAEQGIQLAKDSERKRRLASIAEIIEDVDNRCMHADGPVTPTLQEMTQKEMSEIYHLATGRKGKR
jgi:hypothetical protein